MIYSTERHHCLVEEKIYAFGDRQASIKEFVFLLIRSEKLKILLRSSS